MREVSVKEFLEVFVATSFFQEARLFRYSDIYEYILRCYKNSSDEYKARVNFDDLEREACDVLSDMLKDETISELESKSEFNSLLRVNNKEKYSEISKYDAEYLSCMNKVFSDIHGGVNEYLTLIPSKSKNNGRNNK